MTERDLQLWIIRDQSPRSICLPNWTPPQWWECDVAEITAAGYLREYEVKVTRSDFLADAYKNRRHWQLNDGKNWQSALHNKHSQLSARDPNGPAQFYYVTPAGLLTEGDLPPWAGWIEGQFRCASWRPRKPYHGDLRLRRPAPRLHRRKRPELVQLIQRASYYRFVRAFLHNSYDNENEKADSPAMATEAQPRA